MKDRKMIYYCNSDKEPEELNHYDLPKIKVCGGYDSLSRFNYHKLIKDNKHLSFYSRIKNYREQDQGVIIRWLYRGLSIQQSMNKMDIEITRRRPFVERCKRLN